MSIQAPPNLTPEPDDVPGASSAGADPAAAWRALLDAGINDWGGGGALNACVPAGGRSSAQRDACAAQQRSVIACFCSMYVPACIHGLLSCSRHRLPLHALSFFPPPAAGISPITRDFVNPEQPWPHLRRLAAATAAAGKALLPRLPVYPPYLRQQQLALPRPQRAQQGQEAGEHLWLDASAGRDSPAAAVLRLADADGLARGSTWFAGAAEAAAVEDPASTAGDSEPGRDQQHAAPAAAAEQQQQQQLKSSVPRIRQRRADRSWQVAVGEDGLLAGCPGPDQVAPDVAELLRTVLEDGHELDEAEMELLFSGTQAGWPCCCAGRDCRC